MFRQEIMGKDYYLFFMCTICMAALIGHSVGTMFDFHLVEETGSWANLTKLCKKLGYDGLAITNTPESYEYAYKLSERLRSHAGAYIGTHYQQHDGTIVWNDGTPITSDTPISKCCLPSPSTPHARFTKWKTLRMGDGISEKYGICGHYTSKASESKGNILFGRLDMTSSVPLSEIKLFSFEECSVMCGMNVECRAAEFNSDLLTCLLIGEYSSAGEIADSAFKTYIRKKF